MPTQSPRAINPWFVAVTVTIAAFMELLDTSIANVALPYIGGGSGALLRRSHLDSHDVPGCQCRCSTHECLAEPADGPPKLLPALHRAVHGGVSGCGVAPSLNVMLIARIIQGIGGGGLAPVAQAILVDTLPPAKRAAAFALYTVVIVTAPAVGPVLGGWITDNYNWRWIFFINVPVGILALYLSNKLISDSEAFTAERLAAKQQGHLTIDGIGITLITLASATLEIALDRGQIDDWFNDGFTHHQ
jgi:MFS transporter, DHA2 family, multidrug resistance protein